MIDATGKQLATIPAKGAQGIKANADVIIWYENCTAEESNSSSKMYEYDLKTSVKREVTSNADSSFYDIADVYYVYVKDGKSEIHSVDTKSKSDRETAGFLQKCANVMVAGDYIYFQCASEGFYSYGQYLRTKKDGTEPYGIITSIAASEGGYMLVVERK